MNSRKIWNVQFVAGNPQLFSKIRSDPNNPATRSVAIKKAEKLEAYGWRVWVESAQTGEIIFQSKAERHMSATPQPI